MSVRPPHNISLKVCPVCGRDDRYLPFTGLRHYVKGKQCPGVPQVVEYELVNPGTRLRTPVDG